MADLSDVERDAVQAVQAFAGLDGQLSACGATDERRLLEMVEQGGAAASRVLAYLRELRGAGDGAAIGYPPRLGPWRDWCPPRGHLLGEPADRRVAQRSPTVPRPALRGDPGE